MGADRSATAPRSPLALAPPSELSGAAVGFLADLVARRASIRIGDDRRSLWLSRLTPVARDAGYHSIDELVAAVRSGDSDLEREVVEAMTTNETMFFRDGRLFEALVVELLPRLVAKVRPGGRVTIWSGACSSGQEVYSLAMSIHHHHPELARSGRVRILATDLSTAMVERTRAGSYSSLEVRRGLDDRHLGRFFERRGDRWVVRRELTRMVVCRQLNLMDGLDAIPRCDLVLLRNVLIYFSPQDRAALLEQVRDRVLRPDGALVIGASELIGDGGSCYLPERLSAGVCFRPLR